MSAAASLMAMPAPTSIVAPPRPAYAGAVMNMIITNMPYGHAFEDLIVREIHEMSLAIIAYDNIREFAVQFAGEEHLPPIIWWKPHGISTAIPLHVIRLGMASDTIVYFANFGVTTQGRLMLWSRSSHDRGHIFMASPTGPEISVIKPIRCFLIGTVHRYPVHRKSAELNPEPFGPIKDKPTWRATIGDMASTVGIGMPSATGLTWKPGSKFKIEANGIDLINVKDMLAERVLRHICGGKPYFHTGLVPVKKLDSYVKAWLPSSL